jgi:hypothetical protein
VDRGIIRILDIGFVAKDQDGSVSVLEVGGGLHQLEAAFAELVGASSGLLGDDDLQEAAAALNPGTSAAVLVWENRWAAPVAAALRGRFHRGLRKRAQISAQARWRKAWR